MDRIKVIHICDKFGVRGSTTHGVSTFFAFVMPEFNSTRFDVSLYGLKKPDGASRALEDKGVKLAYLNKTRLGPSILTSFLGLIRSEKPDILHLHGWIAANFGRLAGYLTKTPTIMHEHGVDPKFPMKQRLADRCLAGCTHSAIAVSKSVREFMIASRSVDQGKIRLVYYGAPLRKFSPAEPEQIARVRQELGIPADSKVVGMVGRLDTQKGIPYLLRAARDVARAVPEVRFLIIGDGPRKEEYESQARDLGVAESVKFLGHRSDVQVLQSMMDIQAFPSLWEGTPLTLFEALAMGRAIVSTNVDGLGEVLENEINALVVPPARSELLAGAIVRVLEDAGLASKLAAGAKESGRKYDIAETARSIESLYEELYASRNGGR